MYNYSPSLQFFLSLSKIQTIVTRKFDSVLGGLSESEFMLLSILAGAPDKRMKRMDLAAASGQTLAWLSRLCLPLEKLGLVGREESKKDARMSYVSLAIGGERKLAWALERAEQLALSLIPAEVTPELAKTQIVLSKIEKSL